MSLWNNIQNFGPTQSLFTPSKTTNLFGDNSGGLFGNQQESLFGNNNNNNNNNNSGGGSLFSNQNQKATNSLFDNNTGNKTSLFNDNTNIFSSSNNFSFNNNKANFKECSIGSQFNGINIQDKNGNAKFMSISISPEFSYASHEELRLADIEKNKTGFINQFKIKNTSSNNNNNLCKDSIFTANPVNNSLFRANNPGSTNQGGIFGNNGNNNGNNNLFSFGNNKTGGLFDNSKTQATGLFGNNNTQNTNLLSNNNNTQSSSLFFNNNNNQTTNLFGNNTQTTSIFDNNNQGNSIFGNNTQSGGLFGDNNNKNTQSNNLFGNNNNPNNNNQTGGLLGNQNNNCPNQGGLFVSNNSQGNGNSLFNNDKSLFNNNNNDTKISGLFGNDAKSSSSSLFNNQNMTSTTNNPFSLGNNLNNNDNKTGGSLFNNLYSGFFNSNNKNSDNTKNTGNLFSNINFSFGRNTNNTSSNNTNINSGGALGNINNNNNNSLCSLLNQPNNTSSSTKESSFFNNISTNVTLLGNNNNNQNINKNTPNNINTTNNDNSKLYGNLTLEDIINPQYYLNNQKILKMSPQEEILAQSIIDAVQKQKSVEEFLEDLDKRYENKNKENTSDLLEFYGSYLNTSNDFMNENTPVKRNLNVKNINDSLSSSYNLRNVYEIYNESSSIYNKNKLNKTISKISEIYNEYERYQNSFKNSQMKNYTHINNAVNKNKTENGSFMKNLNKNGNRNKNSNNQMIAKDEMLYQQNLIEFSKLSNDSVITNYRDENNDSDIVITKFQDENNSSKKSNGKKEYNNYKKGNMSHIIDMIIIKYNLPDEDDGKRMHKIILENINKYVKIESLREEISHRVNNELRKQNLHKKYSIERISLSVADEFLINNKTLANYNLNEKDYTIQAFITYYSANTENKEESNVKKEKKQVNNENELIPNDLIPKLTRKGYKCIPSIKELSKKTAEELKKMENFRIFNEFGEVEFKEPINLLGLDLDEQVTIEKNLIDTGDKLNYKSVFKLFNFKIGENGLNKYKVNLKELGGNFLSYNNNELVWEYNGNIPVKN